MVGTGLFAYDAVLNAGILEWGRQALGSSSRHVFEWTAGFPLPNSLANTENLLGWQPAYALLRSTGVSVTFAYNALILSSFFASAVGAQLLARRLGASVAGAFLAGLIFAFAPFHIVHVIHLQTMAICWVPFALYFLDRFLSNAGAGDLAGVAATSALCALSGAYIGFFLALALPLYAGLAFATRRIPFHRTRMIALAVAGIVTAAMLWPVASHYLAWSSTNGFKHPLDVITRFSIELLALVKVPTWLAVWANSGYPGRTAHEAAAFPGVIAVILLVCALVARRRERETTQSGPVSTLLVLAVVFLAFSLGPRLMFRENTPVPFADFIPLPGRVFEKFSAIRWPMRAYLFSLLFGAVIAGLGFTAIARRLSFRWRAALLALLATVIVVEYRPIERVGASSVAIPDPLALSGAYAFLAADADQGGVVELPAADRNGYRTPLMVLSTYGSAGHLRRVVAMHGQGLPPLTLSLLQDAEALPSLGAVERLRRNGVTRVVVHRRWIRGVSMDEQIAAMRGAGMPVLWESDEAIVFALAAASSGDSH